MDWKYLFTSFRRTHQSGQVLGGHRRVLRARHRRLHHRFVLGSHMTVGGGMQIGIVGVIISLASIYFALAVYAKRWHDRDKSGWLSAALIAVFVVGAMLTMVAPGLATVILIVELLVAIWFIVELGILQAPGGPTDTVQIHLADGSALLAFLRPERTHQPGGVFPGRAAGVRHAAVPDLPHHAGAGGQRRERKAGAGFPGRRARRGLGELCPDRQAAA